MSKIGKYIIGASTLCLLLAAAPVIAQESCEQVFPTPISAHGPQAGIEFHGGRLSASPTTALEARTIEDWGLLPRSCGEVTCSVTGEPATTVPLPGFELTESTAALHVGWFGNTTYQSGARDFRRVRVSLFGRLRLAPVDQVWHFDQLSISGGSTLELASGDYWIDELSLGIGSKIRPVGEGTVRLYLGQDAHVTLEASLGEDSDRMVIVGWGDITLGGSTDIHATVYAAGDIQLNSWADLKGDVAGANVSAGLFSEVTAVSDEVRENTDYGLLCGGGDLDGDGIPDSEDDDIDGDGFSNIEEADADTDPRDPEDYPDRVAPSLTLDLAQPYSQESPGIVVTGTVSDEGGPGAGLASLNLANLTTDESLDLTPGSGQYNGELTLAFGDNQLKVTAIDNSGNETAVEALVTRVDETAPVLTLEGNAQESLDAADYALAGSATDGEDGSGIVALSASSDRFPDEAYELTIEEENRFTRELPLAFGDNVISVTAVDGFGHTVTAQKTVTRVDTVAPLLSLDNPPSQELGAPVVTVSGTATDNIIGSGLSSLQITSNRQGVPSVEPAPGSDGSFSASLPLLAGANQLTVSATDGYGNRTDVVIEVIRPDLDGDGIADDEDPDRDNDGYSNTEEVDAGTDPDDADDYPDTVPPELTTDLVDGVSQEAALLVVNGTATDEGGPHSGLEAVEIANAATSETVTASIQQNGDWRAELSLAFGTNDLTITARDEAGNENSLTRGVTREDVTPPTLTLAGAAAETVEQPVFGLSGTVTDAAGGRGVDSLSVTSDRFPEASPAVVRDGDSFTSDVPLAFGDNTITVTATDGAGLTTTAEKVVTRVDTVAPVLTLNNPAEQAVGAPSVTVSGTVTDNEFGSGVDSLTITSARDVPAVNVVVLEGGAFSADIPLLAGTNALQATASDVSGNSATVDFVVTRPDLDDDGTADDEDPDRDGDGFDNVAESEAGTDPDDPADYPDTVAPQLTTDLAQGHQQEAASLTLSGTATDEGGPHSGLASLRVQNTTTGQGTDITVGDNGAWSAEITLAFGENQLGFLATDLSGNETLLARTVTRVDATPPSVTLSGPSAETVESPSFTLQGNATDGSEGRGIASVIVESDRDSGESHELAGGQFSLVLPLAFGDNTITVTVTDGAGLTATAQKVVTRVDTVAPTIALGNAPDQIVGAPAVTVTGSVTDDASGSGVASLVISSDRGIEPVTVSVDSGGAFSASVPLRAGVNGLQVSASDQSGNTASVALTVTRPDMDGDGIADDVDSDRDGDGYPNDEENGRGTDPDDPADYPDDVPPSVMLDSLPADTTDSEIVISGQASDNRELSSVEIRSDRYQASFDASLASDGGFQATVPLRLGDNNLTAVAIDAWDNETTNVATVRRLSPPKLEQLQPASGTVLDADRVTLSGVVATELPEEKVRLEVNGSTVVFGARQGAGYHFSVPNLPLSFGENSFVVRASSPDGADVRTVTLSRLPDDPASLPAPTLKVLSPGADQWFSGEAVDVVGQVESHAGEVVVTVNGTPVDVVGSGTRGIFTTQRYFADQAESLSLDIRATDALDRTSSETITVRRDLNAPVISLDNPLSPAPAENIVRETPLRLTGTVTDSNLAGVLIAGRSPQLEAMASPGTWRFSTEVSLGSGSRLIALLARDDAGNVSEQHYQLALDPAALLTPLIPADGEQFLTDGAPVTTQVAARLAGVAPGASARVLVDGEAFPLNLQDTAISGEVALPATTGDIPLRFEVTHPDAGLVAAAEISVDMRDRAAESLALTRTTPSFNSNAVQPNQLVTLYFNKPVDTSLLSVEVRETLHGPTYINDDPPGTDFLRAKGYEIKQVNRDRQLLDGTFDLAPGGRALSFKPDRFFGYGSTVFVEVNHDGEPLGRGSFRVVGLPTQVNGGVMDQFDQPVGGVAVKLGDLSAVTDEQGGFAFGFDDDQRDLKGGEHTLILNPGGADARFGSRVLSVYLEPGRFTRLGVNMLPLLNEEAGYDQIRGGTVTRLANNAVELDLTDASIRDREGRTFATVNLLFLDPNKLGLEQRGSNVLFGTYALQPEGVRVSGDPTITLPVPEIQGTTDWAPEGSLLFVMGLDEAREVLKPVATAEIDQGQVVSVGGWHGEWLDYFAIAPVPPEAQTAVQAYRDGESDWGRVQRALDLR